MRLLILRHGRTKLNDKGYFNGQYDEPLNAEGHAQALAARDKLQNEKITAVYCSPLSRARETCEIVTRGRALPITFDGRLMERSLGSLDGRDLGMSGFDRGQLFNVDYNPELPGGFESWPAVFDRVGAFLDEIIAQYPPDSDVTILLVTHAGTARAVYYHFYPLPANHEILEPKMQNCEIAAYSITPGKEGHYNADYLGLA